MASRNRTFLVLAAVLWNSLPFELWTAPSLTFNKAWIFIKESFWGPRILVFTYSVFLTDVFYSFCLLLNCLFLILLYMVLTGFCQFLYFKLLLLGALGVPWGKRWSTNWINKINLNLLFRCFGCFRKDSSERTIPSSVRMLFSSCGFITWFVFAVENHPESHKGRLQVFKIK